MDLTTLFNKRTANNIQRFSVRVWLSFAQFLKLRKISPSPLDKLGPLYHEYSFFGIANKQRRKYVENQKVKSPIIIAYIAYAIAKSKHDSFDLISFTELFCADGYYAMVAANLGCDKSIGIDNNRDGHFTSVRLIAETLNLGSGISFIEETITPTSSFESTDIVANVGGLYHLDNPEEILVLSYQKAKKYLIVQTVVSLATEDENYFEYPAPGWTWGNRYSRNSFDKLIRRLFPKIIYSHFNELKGNYRLEDKGSVYYLIEK